MTEAAFDSVFSSNANLRKRALASLLEASEEQAQEDGGRFMPFSKMMKLVDAAVDETGDPAQRVMEICKEEKIPVPENAMRRRFESICVDRYHRSEPNNTHLVFHQMFRKKMDTEGLVWYRYLGTEAALKHCKKEAMNLGILEERIRIIEDEYIKICFRHPSMVAEKPKTTVVQDEAADEDDGY